MRCDAITGDDPIVTTCSCVIDYVNCDAPDENSSSDSSSSGSSSSDNAARKTYESTSLKTKIAVVALLLVYIGLL